MDGALLAGIIGSFLGFLATLLSGVLAEYFKERSVRKSYRLSFKLELKDAQKSLDEIKNAQERQNNTYDFTLLDLLDRNVANLQETRKKVHLLRDDETQSDAYAVISKLSVLAKEMRGIQNYEYGDDEPVHITADAKKAFVKDKKAANDLRLLDVKRDINDLVKRITK